MGINCSVVSRGQEMFCGCSRFRFGVRVIYGTAAFIKTQFRAQSAHYRAVCAGPKTEKHQPTTGGPETTLTEVLEIEKVQRSIFETKLSHFVPVRKARLC